MYLDYIKNRTIPPSREVRYALELPLCILLGKINMLSLILPQPNRHTIRRIQRPLSLLVCLLFISLTGCASLESLIKFGDDDEKDLNYPAKELAIKGMNDYNVGKYFTALDYFEEILNKHPFSTEATLAELKAADCNYFMERYAEALLLYQEYEERHPTNEAIPYVMYQQGMCNYQRIDRVDRDTSGAIEAIESFNQLLQAFPQSPYTNEVKARIRAAEEFLVNHEFFVVKFYLRTEKYSQAEARLKYLIAAYPEAEMIPQAKELLQKIEAGEPPKSSFLSWLPKLSLPSWTLFTDDKEEGKEKKLK